MDEERKSNISSQKAFLDSDGQLKAEHAKVILPFDLNNLFNLQYSFDQLKEVIEWLAKQQAEMKDKIAALESAGPLEKEVIVKEIIKEVAVEKEAPAPQTT